MTATAKTIAGVGTSVSRGATAWNNPSRITVDQGSATTGNSAAIPSTGAAGSNYLVASGFGFSVPAGATIDGVAFEARQLASGTTSVTVQLQDDAAALAGASKSYSATASSAVVSLGSSSEKWGATLTPTTINDSDFGVRLWTGAVGVAIRVDAIWLTVYYTTADGVKALARSCGVVGTA